MSVIRSELMAGGAQVTVDKDYRRKYTLKYLVTTSSDSDLQPAVLNGSLTASPSPVPAMWSPFNPGPGTSINADPEVFLQNKSVERYENDEGNRRRWVVTCEWSHPEPGNIQEPGSPEGGPSPNPLLRPVTFSVESSNLSEVIAYDQRNDRPLVNAAGDFYTDIEREFSQFTLVATKNEPNLTAIFNKAVTYQNKVNSNTFYGQSPNTCRVESINSGPLQAENGYLFYSVTYRILLGIKARIYPINKGSTCFIIDAEGNKVKTRPTVKGGPADGVWLDEAFLDAQGFQLDEFNAAGDPILPQPFPADGYWLYDDINFDGLGIGG